MKTIKNTVHPKPITEQKLTPADIKVLVKYDQPQYLFAELPAKYRNLMDFDIALIKEHFANKNSSSVFLHEPYFESGIN